MIKLKKKICVVCGEERYIFSHGRCRACANTAYVMKAREAASDHPEPRQNRRSPTKHPNIPPRTKKPSNTELWLREHWGFESQVEVFNHIWEASPHVCRFTGQKLSRYEVTDMWYACFLHILPKGKYPLFKLNPENIVLGSPLFHTIVDQGTEADRALRKEWNFSLWDRMVGEKKAEYEQFKKEHLL